MGMIVRAARSGACLTGEGADHGTRDALRLELGGAAAMAEDVGFALE